MVLVRIRCHRSPGHQGYRKGTPHRVGPAKTAPIKAIHTWCFETEKDELNAHALQRMIAGGPGKAVPGRPDIQPARS